MPANSQTSPSRRGFKLCFRASFAAAAIPFLFSGCSPSTSVAPAPKVIRGEPINSAASSKPTASATNSASPARTQAAPALVETKAEEYPLAGFDKLSAFNFEVSDELLNPPTNAVAAASAKADALIPATVKAFDKKRMSLKGFMLPLKVDGGLVTEFLIMKDQSMCCYGVVPKINEWVSVKMVRDGVKPIMDQPVTMQGMMHVGEMRENGYLVGIYSMDAEKMLGPE